MKSLIGLVLLACSGCATGSLGWGLNDDETTPDQTTTTSTTGTTSNGPTSSSTGSGGSGGSGGSSGNTNTCLPNPNSTYIDTGDKKLDDQGIVFGIDDIFWSQFILVNDPNSMSDTTVNCLPDASGVMGTIHFVGSVKDDTSTGHLNVSYDITVRNCFLDSAYSEINLTYTGSFHVGGYLLGGAYEDALTFTSDGFSVSGKIEYNDGTSSMIEETGCCMNFADNFLEAESEGGLQGFWCGRKVAVAEEDATL